MLSKRLILLTFLTVLFSEYLSAERYRVTQDSFGQYEAEQVELPPQRLKDSTENEASSNSPSTQSDQALNRSTSNEEFQSDLRQKTDNKLSNSLVHDKSKSTDTDEKPRELSVFERKYLESLRQEQAEALQAIKKNTGHNEFDATAISEGDYIDGDLLEGQGGIRDGDRSPYYIEVDAEGRVTTKAYDPLLEKAFRERQREKKFEFTEATVYERGDRNDIGLPETADPIAKQLLGGVGSLKSYFDSFSESCCEALKNERETEIERGVSYFFELSEDDLPYRFKEGDSRYVLLRLPEIVGNYPLRLRTFIRKFKDKGIGNGVFFPQLVTLDLEKRPVRIITGPLLKYVPETWMKYGYLEGVFDIQKVAETEEAYLLINTTKKTLRESSFIELKEDPIRLEHMNVGSIEIELLNDG